MGFRNDLGVHNFPSRTHAANTPSTSPLRAVDVNSGAPGLWREMGSVPAASYSAMDVEIVLPNRHKSTDREDHPRSAAMKRPGRAGPSFRQTMVAVTTGRRNRHST